MWAYYKNYYYLLWKCFASYACYVGWMLFLVLIWWCLVGLLQLFKRNKHIADKLLFFWGSPKVYYALPLDKTLWNISTNTFSTTCSDFWPVWTGDGNHLLHKQTAAHSICTQYGMNSKLLNSFSSLLSLNFSFFLVCSGYFYGKS